MTIDIEFNFFEESTTVIFEPGAHGQEANVLTTQRHKYTHVKIQMAKPILKEIRKPMLTRFVILVIYQV